MTRDPGAEAEPGSEVRSAVRSRPVAELRDPINSLNE